VGSRSKIDLAYIAGFLDGDGSLMLQIKKRKEGRKWRFMATICFYQDSRHNKNLYWIKKILRIGYISKRSDGITELRINGFEQTHDILSKLIPFIRFKKPQAQALLVACRILSDKTKQNNKTNLKKLVGLVLKIQNDNYVSKRKKTREELLSILDLTP